jgi:hypothetical protein
MVIFFSSLVAPSQKKHYAFISAKKTLYGLQSRIRGARSFFLLLSMKRPRLKQLSYGICEQKNASLSHCPYLAIMQWTGSLSAPPSIHQE